MSITSKKLNTLKHNLSAKLVDISVCVGRSDADSADVLQEMEVIELLAKQARRTLSIKKPLIAFADFKEKELAA